ncbi:MAG: nitrogen regulation protein NR(I) [Alphaproteobacteria bacterium]
MTGSVLVADDDASIRRVLTEALSREGYAVKAAADGRTLFGWAEGGEGDVVVTDVIMPDIDGLDLLARLRRARPDLPVIVMSARSTLMTAVEATQGGAFDYLPKPFDLQELVDMVGRALGEGNGRGASVEAEDGTDGARLIGRSSAMQELFRTVARLAGTDLTALITGESGTGKELVARALHDFSRRRAKPFVAVNVAAIPRELVESELFGHERGAFTGATGRRAGRFAEAEGGSLFLDEIGDMPIDAQTRLLRVLQQGEFTPIGARGAVAADVRILSATNQDPAALVRRGALRQDLFYRLNVVPVRVPPLRERRDDIPALVAHFMAACEMAGLAPRVFSADALERLRAHPWPGNVRELRNVVSRALLLGSGDTIDAVTVAACLRDGLGKPDEPGEDGLGPSVERHLRAYFRAHGDALPIQGLYERVLREVERPLVALTLDATRGNQLRAAEMLGLNRNTLRKKIRELGIAVIRGGRE